VKILMLSWEFPPKVVGGIAAHVQDLSLALAAKGQEVHVLTTGIPGTASTERIDGVSVHRVQMDNPEPPDFLPWVLQLNINLVEKAFALQRKGEEFQLIHAHDWLTAYAGKLLKHVWRLPLVATIHATEWGRNNGLHNSLQRYISDVEWWLGFESWKVICCSRHMFSELRQVFQLPADKLKIIPNGVYPENFRLPAGEPVEIRGKYASPDEKIIFFVGRLVREKGLDNLLEAMVKVLDRYRQVKLVIAGKGPYEQELKERARRLGIYERVYFSGYLDDATRNALFRLADMAVFPSFYEPFGIVALEAMAAGTPVVVNDTGGLGEVVRHGKNGLKAFTNSIDSLTDNILWLLNHPEHGEKMQKQALREIDEVYNWDKIALSTLDVYEEVWRDYLRSSWKPVTGETAFRENHRPFPARGNDAAVFHRYIRVEDQAAKSHP